MPKAILHIGAPKCGSSSLQSVLSLTPSFKNQSGQAYDYLSVDPKGQILKGDGLALAARRSPFGYMSAPDLPGDNIEAENARFHKMFQQSISDTDAVPVFSSEGWMARANRFAEAGFLERAGIEAEVVLFVRPPIEWLNSAWWQWGVWCDVTLQHWMRANIKMTKWAKWAQSWSNVPGVSKVHLRLAKNDVVGQFCDLIDLPRLPALRSNTSVSPELLFFFLRNRKYRPGPHSPQIEFILGRWVSFSDRKTPWAVPPKMRNFIMKSVEEESKELLSLLEPGDAEQVKNDPRWWDAAAYDDYVMTRKPKTASRKLIKQLEETVISIGSELPSAELTGDSRAAALIDVIADHDAKVKRQRAKAQKRSDTVTTLSALKRA